MSAMPNPFLPQAPRGHALALALPWALAGWVAGTAAQLQQAALWPAWAYGGLLALALLCAAAAWQIWRGGLPAPACRAGPAGQAGRTGGRLTTALLCALCAALLAYAATGLRALQRPRLPPQWQERDVLLTGRVSAMPQRSADGRGWRFAFVPEQAQADTPGPAAAPLPALLQLSWHAPFQPGADDGAEGTAAPPAPLPAPAAPSLSADAAARLPPPDLRAGDRWRFTVRLRRPHGELNPHGFDQELWLWTQGLAATGTVRTGARAARPERLATAQGAWLQRQRQRVRDAILQTPAPGLPAGQATRLAGIVAALVTGDQRAISPADWDMFRATGVAHLMSISGLHITLFAWLAVALLGRLWRHMACWPGWRFSRRNPCLLLPAPTAALLGGVALAGGYALFSGWGLPAQRTVLMLATLAALRLGGLRWPWPLAWLLACALVLAWEPWALLQAGFWLSFVAVGVLFATQTATSLQAHSPSQMRENGLLKPHALRLLREQWVITLALTPLTLLLFGQASLAGLVANLLAIPWVTLLITPLALLGLLWPPLWQAAAWALTPLDAALQTLARWPFASLHLPAPPLAVGAAALAGGLLLALPWPWRARLAALPLLLPLALWQPARPPQGQFELLAADVGQGSAVIVRTARHTLLYDAGPRHGPHSDAGQRVLLPLLRALGARPDMLLLSHGDSDHTGGAPALLAAYPGAALLSSIPAGHALQSLRPALRCQAGQHWQWDGVRFEVLHPTPQDYARAQAAASTGGRPDDNALSCVLRVQAAPAGTAGHASAQIPAEIPAGSPDGSARHMPNYGPDNAPEHRSGGQPAPPPDAPSPGRPSPRHNGKPPDSAPGSNPGNAPHSARNAPQPPAALLTGDIQAAQERALLARHGSAALRAQWLLAPHHGSRSSSSAAFIDAVAPRWAVVQAGWRNRFGHPAPQVLARYAARGAQVVSTPQCGAALWRSARPGEMQCQRPLAQRYWHDRPE